MNTNFLTKYSFHLIYPIVYIGFLLQDKQWFSRNNDWFTFAPTFVTYLGLMFALVYFNTLILIPRFLLKGKVIAYTVGILLSILAFTYLRSLYTQYIFSWLFNQPEQPLSDFVAMSFVYGVWFTVISSMLYITQSWYEQKQIVRAAEVSKLENELKYLRAQMNPHFLFNGLNTIYGSIDKENKEARDILLQFSDLLRYSIYEADADFVPLDKEVRHLESYVALQRARSNPNVSIDLQLSVTNMQIPVAPMLFLPLVENAFKFVTRDEQQKNYVEIKLEQSGNTINFSCVNSMGVTTPNTGGLGLINVKRRLELLYKDKHQLTIDKSETSYQIKLILTK